MGCVIAGPILENWAWDSEGIALISGHVETGETLPQDKLDALLSAKNFQSGMQTLRQIEFALFDLRIHISHLHPIIRVFWQRLMRCETQLLSWIRPSLIALPMALVTFCRWLCVGLLFVKWAELLSADAFGKFEGGVFNADTGKAFRRIF